MSAEATCRLCGVPIRGAWAAAGLCAVCQRAPQGSAPFEQALRVPTLVVVLLGGATLLFTSTPRPLVAVVLPVAAGTWCLWWLVAWVVERRAFRVGSGLWRTYFATGAAAVALAAVGLMSELALAASSGVQFLEVIGAAGAEVATSGNPRAARWLQMLLAVAIIPGVAIYFTWLAFIGGFRFLRNTAQSLGGWSRALSGPS